MVTNYRLPATRKYITSVAGRIGINVWSNTDGEAKGQLTFNTNSIKLLGGGNKSGETAAPNPDKPKPKKTAKAAAVANDLPF